MSYNSKRNSTAVALPAAVVARQQRILDELQAKNVCTYKELEKLLGVSSMTVRRDVESLAKRDALIKTLGGAQYANVPQFLYETSLSSRIGLNRVEKELIAASALEHVLQQQTVFLDGSTTCIAFARLIAKSNVALTVITSSAIIAMELGTSPEIKVICLGGEYDPQSASFVGALAEEGCGKFFVDTAFMSTKAILPDEGTFESSIGTLRIKQLISKRSSKVALLADSSKFGQRALCMVLGIRDIHLVITDAKCPKNVIETLRKVVPQVVIAEQKIPVQPAAT